MKTIKKEAEALAKQFTSKTRDNGESFVYVKEGAPNAEFILQYVREAHDGRLPDDWVYGTFADLLSNISEYDVETPDDLDNVRHEIVDSYVDVYTHELTKWLHSSVHNVEYLGRVQEEYGTETDGYRLLAMAQYMAIDEVMNHVVQMLTEAYEDED